MNIYHASESPRSGRFIPVIRASALALAGSAGIAHAGWGLQDTYQCTDAYSYLGEEVDLSGDASFAIAGGINVAEIFEKGFWERFWPSSLEPGINHLYGPAVAVTGNGHAAIGSPSVGDVDFFRIDSGWQPGGTWTSGYDGFGTSVDFRNDVAVVGSPRSDGKGGIVSVFKVGSNGVTLQYDQDVWASTQASGFGTSVCLAGDYLAVGAPLEDPAGTGAGAVYIYKFDGTSWELDHEIRPARGALGQTNGQFGVEVDLARWSRQLFLVVGTRAGSSFIYRCNLRRNTWDDGTKFALNGAGAQIAQTANQDSSVLTGAVAIDQGYAAFGAEDDDKVIVYKKETGGWTFDSVIASTSGQRFGASIDLCQDRLVVGAPSNDERARNSGAVYFYQRN